MWRIVDLNNLYLAFWKAKRGKKQTSEMIRYKALLSENILELQKELIEGKITVGNYRYFMIHDPKERLICASPFKERVLQHAIMNICHENFERYQIYHSYASRKGKGVYAAIEKAQENQHKYRWYLKMDVRKYFDSIDHEVLMSLLERRFKEEKLLRLFQTIVESYSVADGKGLPVGNLTSQYFANHYLAVADHYLIEKLHIKAMVRYMDDIVVWDNEKENLMRMYVGIKDFWDKRLKLTLKPICLNQTRLGLPFCGYRIFPAEIKLGTRAKKRFKQKYEEYEYCFNTSVWDEKDYQKHIIPLLAYVKHANSWKYRYKIIYGQ